jgi:SAM-dependent methyltransferase
LNIKKAYSLRYEHADKRTLYLNERLFNTYNRISLKIFGNELGGINIDLGCGDKGFSAFCDTKNITSYPYDYPEFNIETQILQHNDDSIDFVTMNAVIEHIHGPDHIFSEIKRVLKKNGLVFIRTPNWLLDFKNFYNDPTHVKPYTPEGLKHTLELTGFKCIFLEPGLVEKSWVWWQLPNHFKWKIASLLRGGTKSILAVGIKSNDSREMDLRET